MKDTNEMKDLLVRTMNRMSMYPVKISERTTLRGIIYDVEPDAQDVGKIIGQQGNMIAAFDLIWNRIGAVFGKVISINVIKTDQRAKVFPKFKADPDYVVQPEISLLEEITRWLTDDGAQVNAVLDREKGE